MTKNVFRKGLVIAIIFCFVGTSIIPSIGGISVKKPGSTENGASLRNLDSGGNTLYVGGSGPGNYSSIQSAINDANSGDTVYVYSGTYYEAIAVNKAINLVGEDRDTTIIDGNGNGTIVKVFNDYVNISGFTFQNSLDEPTKPYFGIEINSNYNIISDNHFGPNNMAGITIDSPGKENIISGNTFSNNYAGVRLNHANNNTIKGNMIYSNLMVGITMLGACDNVILNNTIYSNDFFGGVFLGDFSYNNTISGNKISSNYYGIWLDNGQNNIISENIFSDNECGIFIGSIFTAYNNISYYNILIGNTENAYIEGNIIYHNNIIGNTENAYDKGNNIWDNGKEGNYWGDYTGTDADGDGIGDTPYPIPGGDNEDNYPLMTPYGPPHADFNYTTDGKTVLFNASWSYDYNGMITSYDWDFGDSTTGTGMLVEHTYSDYGTYTVTLTVTDDDELTDDISKDIILINNPPYPPSNPSPENGATDVDVDASLFWDCSDPDGDDLTFDVYFGTSSNPPLVSSGQSQPYYNPPGQMQYNTHYYWKIIAWDPYGESTSGPIWSFTTSNEPNNPPYEPSDPMPDDGATDIDVDADLSWTGGDPDPEDTVVYNVYMDADNPDPDTLVSQYQTETTFDPGTMEYDTVYYWRISAIDNHNRVTKGPIWHFTTEEAENQPPSAPIIDGKTSGNAGTEYEYTFNAVDPDGDNVKYYIDWDDGDSDTTAFSSSGTDVKVKHTWSTQGTYIIKAKAEDTNGLVGPEGTLSVSMPRNRATQRPFLQFLQNFLQQYPILYQLLLRFLRL